MVDAVPTAPPALDERAEGEPTPARRPGGWRGVAGRVWGVRRRAIVRSLVRFGMLSGFSFVVNFGVTIALHDGLGWPAEAAFGAALATVFVTNFLISRYFVFADYRASGDRAGRQLGLFALTSLLFRGTEWASFAVLHDALHLHYTAVMFGVLSVSAASKFLVYRFVVFARRDRPAAPTRDDGPSDAAPTRRPARRVGALDLAGWACVAAVAVVECARFAAVPFAHPYAYDGDAVQHVWWMAAYDDPALFPDDPAFRYFSDPSTAPLGHRLIYRALMPLVHGDPLKVSELLPFGLIPLTVALAYGVGRRVGGRGRARGGGRRFGAGAADGVGLRGVRVRRAGAVVGAAGAAGRDVGARGGGAGVAGGRAAGGRGALPADRRDARRGGGGGDGRAGGARPSAAGAVAVAGGAGRAGAGGAGVAGRVGPAGRPGAADRRGDRAGDAGVLGRRAAGVLLRRPGRVLGRGPPLGAADDATQHSSVSAVALAGLVALRPRAVPGTAWALLGTSAGLFFLAHAVLFRLYLPNRYIYYSLPVAAMLVACAVLPRVLADWTAGLAGRVNPLARPAIGFAIFAAVVAGYGVAGARALAGPPPYYDDHSFLVPGVQASWDYLRRLPKGVSVAAHPLDADQVPLHARRSILAGRDTSLSYHLGYYRRQAERLDATFDALYATDWAALDALHERFGTDLFLVNPRRFADAASLRYYPPFTERIERLRADAAASGRPFVLLDPPADRVVFRAGEMTLVRLGPDRPELHAAEK